MKAAHLLFILILGSLGIATTQAAPQKVTPLFWPEQKLIPMQVHYKEAMSDGLDFTITEFSNSTLPLYSPSMKAWKQVGELTHRNASAAFANNRNASIKTGITLVKSKDWLGELNKENLDRYVQALRNLHSNYFTLLNSDPEFSPVHGSAFLVGNPYKMVHYHIASRENPNAIMEIRDFITQIDDTLLIVSFESPKDLASHNTGMALNLMASLSSLDDLE